MQIRLTKEILKEMIKEVGSQSCISATLIIMDERGEIFNWSCGDDNLRELRDIIYCKVIEVIEEHNKKMLQSMRLKNNYKN